MARITTFKRIQQTRQAILNLEYAIETLVLDGVSPDAPGPMQEYDAALRREKDTLAGLTVAKLIEDGRRQQETK